SSDTTATTATTASTTSTAPSSTTTTTCPPAPPLPPQPVKSPTVGAAQLLTDVSVASTNCVDDVTFDFTSKTADPPSYTIQYQPGPFVQDGSGAPVTVKGNAFIVVKLSPAYGFDFETNKQTYTGPQHVVPPTGAHHVAEVVETGDFESVVTWVIGVDSQRPFTVEATGIPQHRLVISVF